MNNKQEKEIMDYLLNFKGKAPVGLDAPNYIKSKDKKTIIKIATKHKYEYRKAVMVKCNAKIRLSPVDAYVDKKKGFLIIEELENGYYNKPYALIAYTFIRPNARRKGCLTNWFNKLKERYEVICFTTNKISMFKFAEKEGFYNMCKADFTDETCFCWSKYLTRTQISKMFYRPNKELLKDILTK